MPNILGVTNPVPGRDNANSLNNRNVPLTQGNTQNNPNIQNVPDLGKVVHADGRTDRQDNTLLGNQQPARFDSNFETFVQRLREAPNLAEALGRLFGGREGTVVLSGMSAGVAEEMSQIMQMMHMTPEELLEFLKGQMKNGSRCGGALFALLRNAYANAASAGVREDILRFVKTYMDHVSSDHIGKNILRNLQGMVDGMPASWGEKIREMMEQIAKDMEAGDRDAVLETLRQKVFPHMGEYVARTHDLGTPRELLSMLTLDLTRYENGSLENLLDSFRRLVSYGTLKDQLGGIDDQSLLTLLRANLFDPEAGANQFADHLAAAAARALSGEGDANVQNIFRQLVAAMVINESVYMPVNHFIIPLEWDGKFLFSELWVDPDAEQESETGGRRSGKCVKILFKMDVQGMGAFDVLLTSMDKEVNMNVLCPGSVTPFADRISQALSGILTRNGFKAGNVVVRQMQRPLTLTEVFPQIFERRNSVNVKV